jgi:transcription elongation factor Elf1
MDCCFYCNMSFDYEKSKLNCPYCNKVGHLSCILDLIKYNSFCRNCGKILKVHN